MIKMMAMRLGSPHIIFNVIRLYNTVKFLRWEQVVYRLLRRMRRRQPPKKFTGELCQASFYWESPSYINQCLFTDGKTCFLGEEGELRSLADWNSAYKSKLWLYNAHYFDDLNAIGSVSRSQLHRRLMRRWIDENPPVKGNGWEPYPISLRLVNWVKWLSRQSEKDPLLLVSLRQQSEALLQQLEYHILGNHLFANAKALVFVGAFLKCERSPVYLKKGLSLLNREINEQFLKDGGHFERSPMYHEILLWDLFDLITLAQTSGNPELEEYVNEWRSVAQKAMHWLSVMTHPDNEISFFNDAAIGIAPSPRILSDYAQLCDLDLEENKLGHSVFTLEESGYSRIEMPGHVVLFDHAAIGPGYLPGHAHADSLSIEWSVGNQRVLVNSGTSLYGVNAERLRQRQTAAHNTVVVNDQDSSEVWGGFRVARRANCVLEFVSECTNRIDIQAYHDGYRRLKGRPIHRRRLTVTKDSLTVTDSLTGVFDKAYAVYHFHPDMKLRQLDNFTLKIDLDGPKILVESSQLISIQDSTWHPQFGVSIISKKIISMLVDQPITMKFTII